MQTDKTYPMKIIHINARSLRNKRNELLFILEKEDPDVIIITEHWLNEIESLNFEIDNYIIASISSRKNSRGGGVLILAKNTQLIKCTPIASITNANCEGICEIAAIKVRIFNQQVIVIGIYHPPASSVNSNIELSKDENFLNILQEVLMSCNPLVNDVVVGGDFNTNFLQKSCKTTELINLLKSCGFNPIFNSSDISQGVLITLMGEPVLTTSL